MNLYVRQNQISWVVQRRQASSMHAEQNPNSMQYFWHLSFHKKNKKQVLYQVGTWQVEYLIFKVTTFPYLTGYLLLLIEATPGLVVTERLLITVVRNFELMDQQWKTLLFPPDGNKQPSAARRPVSRLRATTLSRVGIFYDQFL